MKRYFLLKVLLLVMGIFTLMQNAQAQRVALKTNGLLWATLSPNIGAEFRVSRRFTVNAELAGNPVSFGDFKPNYVAFQPEVRYWFSGRPHARWFVGVAGLATYYDMCFNDTNHDGTAFGGGVTGGYSFVLGNRWSLETTLGLGVIRTKECKFQVGSENPFVNNNNKTLVAPIKAGVTLVYILK